MKSEVWPAIVDINRLPLKEIVGFSAA